MAAALVCLVMLTAAAAVASASDSPPTLTEPLVPALMVFGDSSVDVGNNNYIAGAAFKANYAPYGEDYRGGATGRFSDGRLVIDFTAESLGFSSSPPPYLSPEAAGQRLRSGANFASAGCGYSDETSKRYNAISLTQQLEYFKEYRLKLARVAGKKETARIISQAVYILSTGNGDLIQNYYINTSLKKAYPLNSFYSILISNLNSFVKGLYGLGARRIGVISLPAMGCFPATTNHYGMGRKGCVEWLNRDAAAFIAMQRAAVDTLAKELGGLKIGLLDIYQPLVELATNASQHGFVEATRGCCVTGTAGTTVLCTPKSPYLCSNSSQYVYWDGLHPTEAANKYISETLLLAGISLIF